MELWLAISGIILLISLILLVMLLKPKKRKPPPRRQVKKTAPPPPQVVKPSEPQAPGKSVQNLIIMEKKKRKREATRKWVGENPAIAAKVVRSWLNQGRRRV